MLSGMLLRSGRVAKVNQEKIERVQAADSATLSAGNLLLRPIVFHSRQALSHNHNDE